MRNLDQTAEELFAKIRGRFPGVTLGDESGNVTQEPSMARFFEFPFKEDQEELGKVSITISEEDGVVIMYSQDIAENDVYKASWYDFLKELRMFAKKRMLNFETRDITKSNLERRDYQYLANRSEESKMNESKLYGTSKISYQKVGEARIVIKHTESVNTEIASSRTRNIGKIYIESADGERFMYPFKHLSGARAMARHVAEGGKPFDDFGAHIVGLSEEMNKLRKFKNYMGRSAVMAESLAGYVDVVKDRISTVKKTIESLQKPNYYAESFAAFEKPMMEDVPADVAENWIDQLTIKQFNEELADVFPYIYKLVSEATRAKELSLDELAEVAGPEKCWDGYKKAGTQPGTGKNKGKRVNKCVPEDIALEQGFEEMMGQFSEGATKDMMHDDAERMSREQFVDKYGDENGEFWDNIMGDLESDVSEAPAQFKKGDKVRFKGQDQVFVIYNLAAQGDDPNTVYLQEPGKTSTQAASASSLEPAESEGFKKGEQVKYVGKYVKDLGDVVTYRRPDMREPDKHWIETKSGPFQVSSNELEKAEGKIVPIPEEPNDDDTMDVKINSKGQLSKDDGGEEPEEQKTPLGEFILSYFDRENGTFPKGETAILTMVEKDYGEQYINPAKAFIEKVQLTTEQYLQAEQQVSPEYERMRELAGLR